MSQNKKFKMERKYPNCHRAFVDEDTGRVYAAIVETNHGFVEVVFFCTVYVAECHTSAAPETPGTYANVDDAVKATTAYLDYVLEHATAIR